MALNDIGYQGPSRLNGRTFAWIECMVPQNPAENVRSYDFAPSGFAFDSAFDSEKQTEKAS